jgi:hypothetical protein
MASSGHRDIPYHRGRPTGRLGEGGVPGSGEFGHAPIPGFPQDPRMTDDVLGVVDMILECVKGAYDSDHDPWD